MDPFEPFRAPKGVPGGIVVRWRPDAIDDLWSFGHGYWQAARHQAHWLESAVTYADFHGYPILFLYRHALELYLKHVCFQAARLLGMQTGLAVALPRLWNDHSLQRLWAATMPVLLAVRGRRRWRYEYLVNDIGAVVIEVDRLDPGSYAFRYPVNSRGEASHPIGSRLNVTKFAGRVDWVLEELKESCMFLRSDFRETVQAREAIVDFLVIPSAT